MKKTNWAVLILVAVLVCVLWLADGYVRWRGIMSIQDQVSSTITEKENEPTQHQITTEKENAEMSGTIGGEGTVRKATTDWTFLSCPDYVDYVGAAEKPGATGETEPKAAVVLPLKQPTLEKTFTEGSVDALEHDSCYTLVLDELPLGFLSEGTQSVAVVYPAEIAPGEAGKFQV